MTKEAPPARIWIGEDAFDWAKCSACSALTEYVRADLVRPSAVPKVYPTATGDLIAAHQAREREAAAASLRGSAVPENQERERIRAAVGPTLRKLALEIVSHCAIRHDAPTGPIVDWVEEKLAAITTEQPTGKREETVTDTCIRNGCGHFEDEHVLRYCSVADCDCRKFVGKEQR